ncbi:thiamine ABC transporter ATP-binding protein [Salinarimonas chemoclinalis]|uniref:thiamine ABC transporter ATP-binding protein n=1 Tax=Salinarimonas chemoclinalis TaxID=3241599 RepID=UPI0035577FD5
MLTIDACRLAWPDFEAEYALEAPAGSMLAIVGPSGGGKTTLLNTIAGFETPVSGRLAFDGRDLLPLSPAERPVAMMFQDNNLFAHLSAAQNVALGIRPSLRLAEPDRARVAEALAAVDLSGLEARRPEQLSGGQRQRVALARALVSRKPLLLLDEPFGALDPGLRREMIAVVDALRRSRRITVLITIHTPEDVLDRADSLAFVARGRVLVQDAPRAALDPARDPAIAAFVGHGAPAKS